MRRFIDIRCVACGKTSLDQYVDTEKTTCHCGGTVERVILPHTTTGRVIGDDIPGGLDIKHGLCWPDGTPRRFYSRSEIRREAAKADWQWGHDANLHIETDRRKAADTRRWV